MCLQCQNFFNYKIQKILAYVVGYHRCHVTTEIRTVIWKYINQYLKLLIVRYILLFIWIGMLATLVHIIQKYQVSYAVWSNFKQK